MCDFLHACGPLSAEPRSRYQIFPAPWRVPSYPFPVNTPTYSFWLLSPYLFYLFLNFILIRLYRMFSFVSGFFCIILPLWDSSLLLMGSNDSFKKLLSCILLHEYTTTYLFIFLWMNIWFVPNFLMFFNGLWTFYWPPAPQRVPHFCFL